MSILEEYLPFWKNLAEPEKSMLKKAERTAFYKKGKTLHSGTEDCLGLIIVKNGRLRIFISSGEGKEITLYRLLERDMCLFSAACIMNNIDFDVMVQAEEDTEISIIPPHAYKTLTDSSLPALKYTNELLSSRFSDVMQLIDQILNKRLDQRLSALLLEEAHFSGSDTIDLTHEQLAGHLGTAREVVTRMLKYLQNESCILVKRGSVEITDKKKLQSLAAAGCKNL